MAVVRALTRYCASSAPMLKWPNDVFVDGLKLAGILCERHEDNVIAGIGINVRQREFSPEIASRATSLALIADGVPPSVDEVMETLLAELAKVYGEWRKDGFAAVYPSIRAVDYLKGRRVSICQRDDDESPVEGISAGILPDGSLDVAGTAVYAGEAHVMMGDGKRVKSKG
jgi:BirA family biotin operon repressor/biotin-[acetyl-CoA-carboxylase] ligase